MSNRKSKPQYKVVTTEEFPNVWKNDIYDKAIVPLFRFLDNGENIVFTNIYIEVYSTCYSLCIQDNPNFSSNLYNKYSEVIIYYLTEHVLPHLSMFDNEQLLTQFINKYNDHWLLTKWLNDFMLFVDRFYVKSTIVNGKPLKHLNDVSCDLYKEYLFEKIHMKIFVIINKLINDYRDGMLIDFKLIHQCIDIYESVGNNEHEIYDKYFMEHFNVSSQQYYRNLSQKWINEENVQTIFMNIENKIIDETNIVMKCLNVRTLINLKPIMDKSFIVDNADYLLNHPTNGLIYMMNNDMNVDLKRLFSLCEKHNDIILIISNILKNDIINKSDIIIENRIERLNTPDKTKTDIINDSIYIDDLINIHNKYNNIILNNFNDNTDCKNALFKAFLSIMNKETLKTNTVYILVSYADKILRGSGDKLDETQIEDILNNMITLSGYLTDKDIFEETYRNYFAKRLLNQKSINDDIEKQVISKMKMKYGSQYTAKIEGMINDLKFSTEIDENFNSLNLNTDIQFNVQVLTNGFWPSFFKSNITLPPILSNALQIFNTYYMTHNNSKKLTFIPSLGTVLLKGTIKNKTYEFVVSTLQAVVLMYFNNNEPKDFNYIANATSIHIDVLKRILHSLACGKFKLLKKTNSTSSKTIEQTDTFEINNDFTEKLRKLKIPIPSLDDIVDKKSTIEEDRSFAIDACIVRIMKSRKTLQHHTLISEVMVQLKFFQPNIKSIKKRIESLIDREYLERNDEDSNLYKYLA